VTRDASMMDRVLELPGQLEWGTTVDEPEVPHDRPILMLGMGGSAMGAAVGALAAANAPRPIEIRRTYGLPEWAVASEALVVGVSYSGNTEEVLSGVARALDAGLPVAAIASGGVLAEQASSHGFPLVAVPGGLQPRAAVGYQAAAAVRILGGAGALSDGDGQLAEAADVLNSALGGGDGGAFVLGRDLGQALAGRITIVYGGIGPGALAAYRWKTQINENAKAAAWWHEIPELNHNELQGWETLQALSNESVGVLFLRDGGDHPQVKRRLDLTEEAIGGKVLVAGSVDSTGTGPLARFFSLAAVGDIASVTMAEALGVDPTPVATIEAFKVKLTEG